MNVLARLTREQFLQFVEDYYHGRYREADVMSAFFRAFTPVDDPQLQSLTTDEEIFDHIEEHYVIPQQQRAA